MFRDFRQNVKSILRKREMTYAMLSTMTGVAESTIKSFMSGVNDSRRVAEKIADALNLTLVYKNQNYNVNS